MDITEGGFDGVDRTEQFTGRSNGGIVVTGVEILGFYIRELVMCLLGCCFED